MQRTLIAAGLGLLCSGPALSQVVVFGGADLVYETQLDKAAGDNTLAFEPYAEAEWNGIYTGLWLSVGNESVANEVNLYLGYRFETDNGTSFDAVYTRYIYPNNGGDCCGDITLTFGAPAGDRLGLTIEGTIDPEAGTAGISLGGDYDVSDRFNVEANVGVTGVGDETEWDLGGSIAINDQTSVALTYYDGTAYTSYLELAVSFDTTLFGG